MLTRTLRPTVLALAVATLAGTDAAAQTGRTVAERLDSLAGSEVLDRRVVGTVAVVVKGNDTLLLKGYGHANIEWDVPMPTDAMFELGSVAKQMTFRVSSDTFLIFRGGDLYLSGGSAYTVLKRQ